MSTWDQERLARAALTCVCEAATGELVRQVTRFGAVDVWAAIRRGHGLERWVRRADGLDLDAVRRTADAHRVRFVVPGDDEWPEQLSLLDGVEVGRLGGQPVGLWLRGPGDLARWTAESVAVVGARACTPYGQRVATDLAIDLASDAGGGWTIVSGGAYGIDGHAHRGACAAHGHTVAILANGLDEPYPRGNAPLFEQLAQEQLLVSEVPCGMHATKAGFLARNRLIAALTRGTVVVEAAARSGAANTATWAAEMQRVVMAVPGSIHSSLSTTPHRLVRDGRATLVTGYADVVALLGGLDPEAEPAPGGPARLLDSVPEELVQVREALPARQGLTTGEVARRAGRSIPATLASLGQLQQLDLVRADQAGLWHLSSPSRTAGEARR